MGYLDSRVSECSVFFCGFASDLLSRSVYCVVLLVGFHIVGVVVFQILLGLTEL